MHLTESDCDIDMMELAELLSDNFTPVNDAEAPSVKTDDLHPMCYTLTLDGQCEIIIPQTKTLRRKKKPEKSTKTVFRKGMSVKEALRACDQKPNMSRRPKTDVLVAFPSFDKCDSLVYFPHTIVRYLNSADIDASSKLLNKYMDKSCRITLHGKNVSEIPLDNYKKIMTLGSDLEPDRVMCVHSTKVVENQIIATVYLKVTDVQSLYTNVSRTSTAFNDKDVKRIGLFPERARRFQFYADESPHSEQLTQELMACAQREEDVLLYMRVDFTLTVDDATKKIIHFTHRYELTSLHIAGTEITK